MCHHEFRKCKVVQGADVVCAQQTSNILGCFVFSGFRETGEMQTGDVCLYGHHTCANKPAMADERRRHAWGGLILFRETYRTRAHVLCSCHKRCDAFDVAAARNGNCGDGGGVQWGKGRFHTCCRK